MISDPATSEGLELEYRKRQPAWSDSLINTIVLEAAGGVHRISCKSALQIADYTPFYDFRTFWTLLWSMPAPLAWLWKGSHGSQLACNHTILLDCVLFLRIKN
jgi:hypothetical protein